jgi:hypothetical protein
MLGGGSPGRFHALRWLVLPVLFCIPWAARGAEPPQRINGDDETFIRELETAAFGETVDRKRLSRVLFGIAATLEGGRSAVGLLQSAPSARRLSTEAARELASARFETYRSGVERFKILATELLDRPESTTLLHAVVSSGQRACWRLTEYTRAMESYGLRAPDLVTVLSSTEACAKFGRIALHERVERLVSEQLAEAEALRERLHEATVELEELERLLEDLRRIEESD